MTLAQEILGMVSNIDAFFRYALPLGVTAMVLVALGSLLLRSTTSTTLSKRKW
jgi:hypothetical protein